jgi:hypothetical protein
MKPFITPELMPNGKKLFGYQCEAMDCKLLGDLLKGRSLVAYVLPKGHTLRTAWELAFIFDAGFVLEFSSACTQAVDWQEVGSLNIRLTSGPAEGEPAKSSGGNESFFQAIKIIAVEKVIYEDEDVVVECGLLLRGVNGEEITVAAGVPPGSVSVQMPFASTELFEPQFPISACRREAV